jgi:prephenate dehydratase
MSAQKAVAFLGIAGSYSYEASRALFPDHGARGLPHWPEIFREVDSGRAACLVVPVENALTGRIEGIYQELSRTTLNITQEFILPIRHCLLTPGPAPEAPPNDARLDDAALAARLSKVKQVYSHPQGFLQCREFVARFLPDAELKATTDTANAALTVAEGDETCAAIASKAAAELYGLAVLREDIADETGNATRFLALSKDGFESGSADAPAVTTILFQTRHTPGSLVGALSTFAGAGVNIIKLETYMASLERRKPTFYIDVGAHMNSEPMKAALAAFADHVEDWKVLGSYPASPLRGAVSGFLPV